MNALYFIIDVAALSVPFLFSFHPRLRFDKGWRHFFPAMFLVATFFIIWDVLFTKMGIWSFNAKYVIGKYFFDLPIEEVLFFFFIPYACVFTWHCLKPFVTDILSARISRWCTIILSVVLLVVSAFHLPQLYTSTAFILCASLLIALEFSGYRDLLRKFYPVYIVLLIPFFVVNGLLTGAATEEAVVMYNDHHNLGIRALTIPIEDFFYGMSLILSNIFLYEFFSGREAKIKTE